MVAKADKKELFSDLYFRTGMIIVFVFLIILFAITGLIWIYQFRQKILYKQLYEKDKALKESHEEFKTTFYSIGDGIITADSEGKIKQMNPLAVELTGYTEEESAGKPLEKVFKIINEETRKPVNHPFNQVLSEGIVVGLGNHTLLISRNGREIPIADSDAPIKNENGEILGVVLLF